MMVNTQGSVLRLLSWQQRNVAIYAGAASLFVVTNWIFGHGNVLPSLPLGVVGGALGIFVSFRTNSAYDRWWEGRKLWGRLVNSSRHLATQALTYVRDEQAGREIVMRHVAYVHALRCLLRQQDPFGDEVFRRSMQPEELIGMVRESNLTHALLHRQTERLVALADAGKLDELRLQSIDKTILEMLNIQGGCERIKGTPLPRGYGFIGETLIHYYSLLLPLALVGDLGILTIPINVLVCVAFMLISEAGRVLEDPFTMFWNGLPLTNLSMKIEVNLRQRLGHTDLPTIEGPDHEGILM